jgi:hypothetical protein
MHLFTITIGRRDAPRLEFAAMATDSAAAFNQHVDLAEVGERVEVTPARELQQLANELPRRGGTYLEAPRRVTPEQAAAAAAFKRWDEARRAAHKPAEGTYGRLTCSLCGSPSATQVCGGCSGHLQRSGGRL